ncbi:MAG: hypothetical protein AB7D51_04565 [Desulfovibrionaceae bacterium]
MPGSSSRPPASRPRAALRWVLSALCALLAVWAAGAILGNNPGPLAHDDLIGGYAPAPGTTVSWRSEGWGQTRYGRHGLLAGQDDLAESTAPKFILWCDSHVEALQVPNQEKISFVFNALTGGRPYHCIGYGRSGQSVADYCLALQHFEAAFPNVRGHLFLISGMEDVLPAATGGDAARLLADPWRIEPGTFSLNARGLALGRLLHAARLTPFYSAYRRLREHAPRLLPRLAAGPTPEAAPPSRSGDPEQGWRFLLHELAGRTSGFLGFIYCPGAVPAPSGGGLGFSDDQADLARRFGAICAENGVAFIDMTKPFLRLYHERGVLPRGFFNTPPGTGHLNRHGLRAVAEAIRDHFNHG